MGNPFLLHDIAQNYDRFYVNRVGQLYDRLEKAAISSLLPKLSRGTILDVGCGTGHWSAFFVHEGFNVIGIDESEPMIRIARNKNIERTEFHCKPIEAFTSVEAKGAIGAAFITSLEFMGNPKKILRQVAHLLPPKGFILCGVLNADSPLAVARQGDPVYSQGEFYSEAQLHALLSPLGEPTILQSTFAPYSMLENSAWAEILVYEERAQAAHRKDGVFLAARVEIA